MELAGGHLLVSDVKEAENLAKHDELTASQWGGRGSLLGSGPSCP